MSRKASRAEGRSASELGSRGFPREARRLHRVAPGTWHGPGFYVWDADEAEAERWARTLLRALPAAEGARP